MKQSKPKTKNGISLIVYLDEKEQIRSFILSGHAGFNVEGQDIVCAAISTLSIAAANGLEYFLGIDCVKEVSDGFLILELPELAETMLAQSQWILKTMLIGISDIQSQYGERYVKIDRRRWATC